MQGQNEEIYLEQKMGSKDMLPPI